MEINYRQQQRYSPDKFKIYLQVDNKIIREVDYNELEHIIRDISYARIQSTKYLFLNGEQFEFSQILLLPYWDFLFLKGSINLEELEDIIDGCLLIIALFYIEVYDDDGNAYIFENKLIDKLEYALKMFKPMNSSQKEAVEKIQFLGRYINDKRVLRYETPNENSIEIEREIQKCNDWLYQKFIEEYFIKIAASFQIEKEKAKERMKQIIKNNIGDPNDR